MKEGDEEYWPMLDDGAVTALLTAMRREATGRVCRLGWFSSCWPWVSGCWRGRWFYN